jgi:hypothetical protein
MTKLLIILVMDGLSSVGTLPVSRIVRRSRRYSEHYGIGMHHTQFGYARQQHRPSVMPLWRL